MTAPEHELPAGAAPLAFCGQPGEPQRAIYSLLDGDFILVEGGKVIARASPRAIDNLAIDVVCGDPRASTRPGGILALAVLLVSRSILRSRAALSDPHPAVTDAAAAGRSELLSMVG